MNTSRELLELTPDGAAILRQKCRELSVAEIKSAKIQKLIDDMLYTIEQRKSGVGLSANQVNHSEAISVIAIKPTPARPHLKPFENVCINTTILETFGEKEPMWEGCLSTAKDENGEASMAQVPRYPKVRVAYYDRDGKKHEEIVEGFVAQVLQHETDHLNGKLFTDYIDKNSLISYREYTERFGLSK